MSLIRRQTIWFSTSRQLTGLVVLLGMCASLVPIPLSSGSTGKKDLSQPFPCQHRSCGCRTAEQCWKRCCCFSNAQKVAWAREQRVTPPDFVVAAAKQEQPVARCTPTGCSHCRKPSAPAVPRPVKAKRDTVVIALMQQCQGGAWFWNALPWCVPLPPISLPVSTPVVIGWEPLSCEFWDSLVRRPPVPPPRAVPHVFSAV